MLRSAVWAYFTRQFGQTRDAAGLPQALLYLPLQSEKRAAPGFGPRAFRASENVSARGALATPRCAGRGLAGGKCHFPPACPPGRLRLLLQASACPRPHHRRPPERRKGAAPKADQNRVLTDHDGALIGKHLARGGVVEAPLRERVAVEERPRRHTACLLPCVSS